MEEQSTLGDCPACGTAVPLAASLVSYERNGRPATFAECPGCGDVVRPS